MSITIYTGQLLLLILYQQRAVHNYLLNHTINQQLYDDLQNYLKSEQLKHTILQAVNQVYIVEDLSPRNCYGKWLYIDKLIHKEHPTYQVSIISEQQANRCLNTVGILHIIAMQFE